MSNYLWINMYNIDVNLNHRYYIVVVESNWNSKYLRYLLRDIVQYK